MRINHFITNIAKSKANQSICRYKVSAIGLNKRGEVVATAINKPRLNKYHGGLHAEIELLRKNKSIKTIILCRVNDNGDILPIHPCVSCQETLDKLGIKTITLGE